MDNTEKSLPILSLCTGLLRGLELGIEDALQTKHRTVAYVEIETFVVDNLLQGMEKGVLGPAPIWTNLKTFPYRQFHGKIFGITGGYPCQPFSVAGNRNGDKDPRHLWPYIRRITESTQPVFCFFENVEGHLNLGFKEVSRDLRKMGYRVEAGIYSAEEVGAPHQRKRLFILAVRQGGIEKIKSLLANANGSSNRESIRRGNGEKEILPFVDRKKNSSTGNTFGTSFKHDERLEFFGHDVEIKDVANSESIHVQGCDTRSGKIESWRGCNELADTYISNAQRIIAEQFDEKRRTIERERSTRPQSTFASPRPRDSNDTRTRDNNDAFVFPSRPGENQHEWEEPRVAKSGLGITIDGYNFREDLLRGAGNGVVWQTASKAFSDLLSKF